MLNRFSLSKGANSKVAHDFYDCENWNFVDSHATRGMKFKGTQQIHTFCRQSVLQKGEEDLVALNCRNPFL